MCHIKAFKFSCGHVRHTIVSVCRVTFSNPSKTSGLCRAEPSIFLPHSESCRDCEYSRFQSHWEARIEAARKRKQSTLEMLNDLTPEQPWGAEDIDDCAEGADVYWGDVEEKNSNALEFVNSDDEVGRLYEQYHKERWTKWKWYTETAWDVKYNRPAARHKTPKRPGRRCSETSPLRKVLTPEDFDDEPFESDSSIYSTPEGSVIGSSAGSSQSSPTFPTFAWTEYQWEDEDTFADSLSDALEGLNGQDCPL